MPISNWRAWFGTAPLDAERSETFALLSQARAMQRMSPFAEDGAVSSFVIDVIRDACADRFDMPGVPLGGALYAFIEKMLYEEPFLIELPEEDHIDTLTLEEGVGLRKSLRRFDQLIAAHERQLPRWREIVVRAIRIFLTHLPESAFIDANEDGSVDDDSVVFPRPVSSRIASAQFSWTPSKPSSSAVRLNSAFFCSAVRVSNTVIWM